MTPPRGLAALEARLAQDLKWLDFPKSTWVFPKAIHGQPLLEVAIIGGGMAGLTLAMALKLQGIQAENFDRAPKGFEGPWTTTARMQTLRSPKNLAGPALDLPALTFRAWYEAQFGEAAWLTLDKIPRLQWMAYLRWYRQVTGVVIHNEHQITAVTPHADHVALQIKSPSGDQTILARRVVLATGRAGIGGPRIPDFVERLDPRLWAHSADSNDYHELAHKRVDILIRRDGLPRINKGKGAGNPGFLHGFADLPDSWKWRIHRYIVQSRTPPPHHSVLRVTRHDNAQLHFGSPIETVYQKGNTVHVTTPKDQFTFDFLIAATGFHLDFTQRPEYASFANAVRLWRDRYTPPAGLENDTLANRPDLGKNFELTPKVGKHIPGLERIHAFCHPAVLSLGPISGDIPAISIGAKRLARGLVSELYKEDIEQHYANIQTFDDPELDGSEW